MAHCLKLIYGVKWKSGKGVFVMQSGRVFISILLLVIIFWNNSVPVACAGSAEVLQRHRMLQQREQQMVAEMIQVEMALDRAKREHDLLAAKLAETRGLIPAAKEELAASEQKLGLCRQRLNGWLRHFYIEGRTNYLVILLGAVNLGDLLHRLALVGMLVSRGVRDVNQTIEAIAEVKQRTAELTRLEQQLTSQEHQAADLVQQALALQQTKQKLLDQIRAEFGENQSGVLAVVDGLQQTLKPLGTLLERFRDAPWDKYRPDHLQRVGTRIKAEYSQSTITRLLFGGESGSSARAYLSDHLFTIKGTNQDQLEFTISGELSVRGGNVCYKPMSVVIGGIALSEDLVGSIAGKEGLVYPVGLLMGWRLEHIEIGEGKAIFELSPT